MITLEDGKDYFVTKEITKDDTTYVYLTDMQDVSKFCIRKKDEKKENLIGLKDKEEYYKALEIFKNENLVS